MNISLRTTNVVRREYRKCINGLKKKKKRVLRMEQQGMGVLQARKRWRRRGKVTAAVANRAHARAVCPALYECTSRSRVRAYVRARVYVCALVLRTYGGGGGGDGDGGGGTFMREPRRAYLSRVARVVSTHTRAMRACAINGGRDECT